MDTGRRWRRGCRITWCRRYSVLLEALPLTANWQGRSKGVAVAGERGRQASAYEAPRNEIEQAMCEVMQEVLKRSGWEYRITFSAWAGIRSFPFEWSRC